MRPIFLVGFMGSGKSTLGRAVAQATGIPFVDLDAYIEGRFHRTVKEIFAERGEEGFRELERTMLHEVADFEDVVIACGGGTPCFFDNMDYMNERGVTVYLCPPFESLFSRLKRGRHKRPLIAQKNDEELAEFIHSSLAARKEHYEKSQVVFESQWLENRHEVAETTKKFVTMFNLPVK